MMILLKLIILTFICVMGLKIIMSEDMLLEKVGEWFKKKIDEGHKVYSMFYCEWCMSTLQSITAHAFAFGLGILPFEFNWQLLIRWPLVIMGASFLSGNVWNIYETINRTKEAKEAEADYFKNLNEGNGEST